MELRLLKKRMDLFHTRETHKTSSPKVVPLATKLRPRSLEEYVGQNHILGKDMLLRRMIETGVLGSVIFYGPPSSGKTTLAYVISRELDAEFITLNAVLDGVKELKTVVQKAKQIEQLYQKQVILFVDEIHRWNKAQQDALLPHLESGLLTLIGATTENPFYMLVGPLLSRCQLFELHPFDREDVRKMLEKGLEDKERGLASFGISVSDEALDYLADYSGGDIRNALNALEMAVRTAQISNEDSIKEVGLKHVTQALSRRKHAFNRTGDEHYHYASAYIKSMRGSDPDAALYWLAAMVESGEDPRFIFRRLLIFASEDVGLADSSVAVTVQNLAASFERVGMPEGWYFLAHATLFCAIAPKSNSTKAIFEIIQEIKTRGVQTVPSHLKDKTANKLAAKYTGSDNPSEDYLYPHSYPNHWVEQQYLPTSLKGRSWFSSSGEGFEKRYVDRLEAVRKRREEK